MPRPGPRPYECVRRAWHSDRHQPMRGSLIQEIFRVVNEIHSSATKKNKEWQDKLPLVVLKAEEIIYSKANSEAEYMDLKTLPDRANDAINTIIRRDETTESSEFLPPCIEAALNLGCIPRRASRSQRHNSPRCYLSSTTQEATESSVASKIADNMVFNGGPHSLPPRSSNPIPNSSPQFVPYLSTLPTANPTRLTSGSGCPVLQDNPMYHSDTSILAENFSSCWQDKSSLPMEMHPAPSMGHMCPMYYNRSNRMETEFPCQYPQVSDHDAAIVVTPHGIPVVEAEKGFLQNLLGCGVSLDTPTGTSRASLNFRITSEKPADMGCDLSLRLGPLSTPGLSKENCCIVEDVCSSNSLDGSRFGDLSLSKIMTSQFGCSSSSSRIGKGLSFFLRDPIDEPLESCSSK